MRIDPPPDARGARLHEPRRAPRLPGPDVDDGARRRARRERARPCLRHAARGREAHRGRDAPRAAPRIARRVRVVRARALRGSAMRIAWVLYGSLEQRTGGTIYDAEVVHGLERAGDEVELVSLDEGAPAEALAARLRAIAPRRDRRRRAVLPPARARVPFARRPGRCGPACAARPPPDRVGDGARPRGAPRGARRGANGDRCERSAGRDEPHDPRTAPRGVRAAGRHRRGAARRRSARPGRRRAARAWRHRTFVSRSSAASSRGSACSSSCEPSPAARTRAAGSRSSGARRAMRSTWTRCVTPSPASGSTRAWSWRARSTRSASRARSRRPTSS